MKSTVLKRSIVINRHKTSISIEDVFWTSLKEIAHERGCTLSDLVASIDAARATGTNLSSAIRVSILDHFRKRLEDIGRQSASVSLAHHGERAPHVRR